MIKSNAKPLPQAGVRCVALEERRREKESDIVKVENDLGRDKISTLVFRIAIPSMLAQFVSVFYSIVDRIFVGNIPEVGTVALAGVGVCGPALTFIGAFAFWVGIGGTPLMGITLGEGKPERASRIVANCFVMLCGMALLVGGISVIFREPLLHLFGASDVTYAYAEPYFRIYVSGTIFALISTGMNQFIIAQGYAKTGMCSVILGAVMNIALDPLFIFVFHMGVRGAALATIISQACSAVFVLHFMLRKAHVRLTFGSYQLPLMWKILKMGITPFAIIGLDSVVIIAMNSLLQFYGGAEGDALVTCNTIVQSFMLVVTMPLNGISGGTQGILSYNFGARRSDRVLTAEKYIMGLCMGFAAVMFVLARVAGPLFTGLFTSDPEMTVQACRGIRIVTLAAIPMSIQYALVDGFTALGQVQISLPLSLGRKVVYFLAMFILPQFGAFMIFYGETIADIVGPAACLYMFFTKFKKILAKREKARSQLV